MIPTILKLQPLLISHLLEFKDQLELPKILTKKDLKFEELSIYVSLFFKECMIEKNEFE